ncbi:MAG TPA: DUF1841 family protein [Terriglobia bacterium]|nr:DUF1841 family protein [Terriglobia bacterium]
MPDSKFADLRQLLGQRNKVLYEAVKAGRTADLPSEDQAMARAISEHMHLRHVHNALEFADLREGESYEIEVEGNAVSPTAHLVMHSAVKGQVEADPLVRAAFEKLVASGSSAHQAEHVLAFLFAGLYFEMSKPENTDAEVEKARAAYYRKIKKITQDAAYRKKLARQFRDEHFGFD